MRSRPALDALVLTALLLAGCGDVKSPTEPLEEPGGPAFTFAQIQAQVFTPTCAKAGCHTTAAASAANNLVLEAGQAYGQIVNRPAVGNSALDRIEPGSPERSYLIKKLRGDPDITGVRMPPDTGSLTQEQMDGIVAWVLAGAPNN